MHWSRSQRKSCTFFYEDIISQSNLPLTTKYTLLNNLKIYYFIHKLMHDDFFNLSPLFQILYNSQFFPSNCSNCMFIRFKPYENKVWTVFTYCLDCMLKQFKPYVTLDISSVISVRGTKSYNLPFAQTPALSQSIRVSEI